MTIKFFASVYKTKTRAKKKYDKLKKWDKETHSDWHTHPAIAFRSDRWIVSWSRVLPDTRRRKKKSVKHKK